MDWRRDDDALGLVERSGEPFSAAAYRQAWTETGLGWSDVSFGASTADGTLAAIALLRHGIAARSLTLGYGGVVASRPLDARELDAFLRRKLSAGVQDLQARSVPLWETEVGTPGRTVTTTCVLYFAPDTPATAQFGKKATETIARTPRWADPSCQPALIPNRSGFTQPPPNIGRCSIPSRARASRGRRRPEAVRRRTGGKVEASAAALIGERHRMYWLAAQSTAGRDAELGYLPLAALVEDAQTSGADAVNLGASAGLPGVAQFKTRLGGVDVPVRKGPSSSLSFRAARQILRPLGVVRRRR